MKILVASVDFLPNIGGVSLMAHFLSNALSGHGAVVTVLAPYRPSDLKQDYEAEYELLSDLHAYPTLNEGRPALKISDSVVTWLQNLYETECWDRVLLLHPDYYGMSVSCFCTQNQLPLSTVVHGFEFRSQNTRRARVKSAFFRALNLGPSARDLLFETLNQSAEILTNSQYTAALIEPQFRDKSIRSIGCGVSPTVIEHFGGDMVVPDHKIKAFVKNELLEEAGFSQQTYLVGTVSRLVTSKNVGLLIEAIANQNDTVALIVGSGPEETNLRKLALEKGCSDRVLFRSATSEAGKSRYLMAMDAFCLLSIPESKGQVEGFGIALLEALAAATPIISTGSGGMVDIVQHRKTGLLVKNSPVSLREAIEEIRTNKDFAVQLVNNGQRLINERFNWDAIAKNLLTAWEKSAALK